MRNKIAVVTLSTLCNFSSFSKRKFNRGVKTTVSYTALSALHLTVICGGHLKRIYSEFVETMYDFQKFKQWCTTVLLISVRHFLFLHFLLHRSTSLDGFNQSTRGCWDTWFNHFLVWWWCVPVFTNRLSNATLEFRSIRVREGYIRNLCEGNQWRFFLNVEWNNFYLIYCIRTDWNGDYIDSSYIFL